MYKHDSREFDVRISEKITLTIFEAAALTGIGTKKLAKLADTPGCSFVLYVGAKRYFKRTKLQEFLESNYSI
jgi:excisionase family DNA binding protein